MLIRFYCIVIRSSRMLYMIGIKEISFLMISDLPPFANYMGLSFRTQYQFDNPTYTEHTLYLVYIPEIVQGIQHQKEQLYCLSLIRLKA